MRLLRTITLAAAAVAAGSAAPSQVPAPTPIPVIPGWGRFAFYYNTSSQHASDRPSTDYSELIGNFTLRSASVENGGFEYGFDTRTATYPSGERAERTSIYDAYVGFATQGGTWGVRVGQMWLNEMGGLGAIGGLRAEVKTRRTAAGTRLRFGLFGGLEPKAFDAGYVQDVRKGGAYAAYDGERGRRHVIGYVNVRNAGLVERSTLTTTNFVPIGSSFFFYQAAEYDLRTANGQGKTGLNYLFATTRWAPVRAFEIMGTYHHGRSIDARTITNDQLNGRPVDPRLLEGLLFESANLRLTVEPVRGLRVYASYGREKNNKSEPQRKRKSAGLSASNILRSGIDFTAVYNRLDAVSGGYNSWYASLGRSFGQRVYISLDYSDSLSSLLTTGAGGVLIQTHPHAQRYAVTSSINLSRAFSLLLTGERLEDDTVQEDRLMLGVAYRF